MTTTVYIHGANATKNSFNFLRLYLGADSDILLSYNSKEKFKNNLNAMVERLKGINNLKFIAHSLGGIYAVHLAARLNKRVRGGITISTPYGGLEYAGWLKWVYPHYALFRDVSPTSDVIQDAQRIKLTVPWHKIVTAQNSAPWLWSDNDGTVTVDSQLKKKCPTTKLALGHYEVLLSKQTVDVISNFTV